MTLIERDAIGAHASGCNAGNLNPLYGTAPSLLPAALEAFQLHKRLAAELRSLGCGHYSLNPVKRILLGYDDGERTALEQAAGLFRATDGFSSIWLEREELCRVEPGIGDDVRFGLLLDGSLSVDGQAFTQSLAAAAVHLGCRIVHDAVGGLTTHGDLVSGVRTQRGVIACDEVVFATGPWVANLASWLDIEIQVEPMKGELLLVQLSGDQPQHDLSRNSTCIYRRRDAQIWVGGTWENAGFDASPTAAARAELLAGAARLFPSVGRAAVIRHAAALRPCSPAERPIASRADGWRNAWIANGGGAKGILLCLGIAQTIVDLFVGEATCT